MSLKTYDVRDDEKVWAKLTYDTDTKEFHLSIPKDIDRVKSAILLSLYADAGIFELNAEQSLNWVRQRIIPPERMNIGAFLRELNITEYDEYAFLMMYMGRCTHDDLYLEEVKET